VGGSQNFIEWLSTIISDWFEKTCNTLMDNEAVKFALVIVGLLVVAVIAWLVWKKGAKLFLRNAPGDALDYELEEDTIYGIDFEQRIDKAMMQQNYREAVRLNYLHTLKMLSDAGRIEWQLYKTPSQYTREYPTDVFRQLTNLFLLIRYGNREAGQEQADQAAKLKQTVAATLSRQEGGEP
jgi:hypothetical protein